MDALFFYLLFEPSLTFAYGVYNRLRQTSVWWPAEPTRVANFLHLLPTLWICFGCLFMRRYLWPRVGKFENMRPQGPAPAPSSHPPSSLAIELGLGAAGRAWQRASNSEH